MAKATRFPNPLSYRNEDSTLVGEASDRSVAQRLSWELQPDVLLLGLNMAGSRVSEIAPYLHELCLEVKVLILTTFDNIYVHDLLAAGVVGCVFKHEETETLVRAIRTVAQGHTWLSQDILEKLVQQQISNALHTQESTLTDREQEVLSMIAQGWDNVRIATELSLAKQTVRNYISRIYAKLAVSSRAEAVVWAREHDFGRVIIKL